METIVAVCGVLASALGIGKVFVDNWAKKQDEQYKQRQKALEVAKKQAEGGDVSGAVETILAMP